MLCAQFGLLSHDTGECARKVVYGQSERYIIRRIRVIDDPVNTISYLVAREVEHLSSLRFLE